MPLCVLKEDFPDDETEIALHGKLNRGMITVYQGLLLRDTCTIYI